MGIEFKLRGLTSTVIHDEDARCPACRHPRENNGDSEAYFESKTVITLEGILVSLQCRNCRSRFVPDQTIEIVSTSELSRRIQEDYRKGWEHGHELGILETFQEGVNTLILDNTSVH